MSTENPYVAPLATDEDSVSVRHANQLLALRQRYVYRETTLRAWGLAKLIVGSTFLLFLLLILVVDLRRGVPAKVGVVITLANIAVPSLLFLIPGLGLLRLRAWGRWWQLVMSALIALVAIVIIAYGLPARDDRVLVGMLLLVPNVSLIYLIGSEASYVVVSEPYSKARAITRLSGIVWPLIAKSFAFLLLEILPFVALSQLNTGSP